MTPLRSSRAVAVRRPTRAVEKTPAVDPVATVRLTVKLVLWAAFFTGLFTLHAHLGLRTATLRAETRRLQSQVQRLMDERRHLMTSVSAAADSGRIQRIAETELGMVTVPPTGRLVVHAATVAEVEEALPLWGREVPEREARQRVASEWLEYLASLWAGQPIAFSG